MSLQNSVLKQIQQVLLPTSSNLDEPNADVIKQESSSMESRDENDHAATQQPTNLSAPSTNSNGEFIPHIFYSLHQIRKDPNNLSNQLETSTGSIRHRLKLCKSLIAENEDAKNLLSKSPSEWQDIIKQCEQELQIKRDVLDDLYRKLQR
ncbi:cse2p [Saccharomyces arboricola H-6]|uniref:Mediator of RNA polymerase II transcription subunit 9 n=1 Tax=Saccharomyces arboricola (strain H-6 / AS 2.3317 / CBS 10644) TaxID=1160507 RepID=J8PX01_SACAR|nr:cse2p [Saccharomyces arboricola H-6]